MRRVVIFAVECQINWVAVYVGFIEAEEGVILFKSVDSELASHLWVIQF